MTVNSNISEEELKLLAYLHENAMGYDQRFQLAPKKIMQDLGINYSQLRKDSSYLASHGLIGVVTHDTSGFGDPVGGSFILSGLFLQVNGEDYMRELEKAPGVSKKVT